MFLEASETMSARQTKLRYKKLLSLRILVLALLALLFAEPVINSIKLLTGGSQRHLLVIDTSMSQNHTARWQRSLEHANNILDNLAAGDEVTVISAASRLLQADDTGSDELSVTAARKQIAALTPTLSRLDFSRIANAVSGTVEDSRLPVRIHLITDLQQSAMPERFTDLAIDGIDELSIYSSADEDDSNTSLTATLDYASGDTADISVIVNNYSDNEVTRQLTVSANQATVDSITVNIAPGTALLQRFSDLDTSSAAGILSISMSPQDELSADDSWMLAVPDGEKTDISVVTGTRQSIATTYVTAAIESDPRYRKKDIAGDSLSAGDAGAVVMVPDASVLSDRAASRLQQFINDGGNALIAIGSSPHSSQMRNLLGISSSASNRSTAAGNTDTSNLDSLVIANIDNTHPLTTEFTGSWRALSVLRHLSISVQSDDRRIIDLGDGSPLLLERSIGEGKAIILTSALNTQWNNLAIEPLFVAFIVGSIEYLSGDTTSQPYRSVGDSITVPPGAQILDPAGTPMRELTAIAEKGSIALDSPGIYTIRSATGIQTISVNTDPRESDLNTIDNESLARWRNSAAGTPEDNTASTNSQQHSHTGFWRWLLPLLLIIALAESLFSHRHLWVKRGA